MARNVNYYRRYTGAWAVVALALLVGLTGCALTYPPGDPGYPPERLHPTPEQIAALMQSTGAPSVAEAPFALRFYPAFVLAGGATWQTCHVPPSWQATRIAVTFEGKGSSDVPAYLYAPRLVEHIPCGKWTGACLVRLPTGEIRRVEQTLESRGGPDCE